MTSKYQDIYQRSIQNAESFWSDVAKDIFWYKKPSKILNSHSNPLICESGIHSPDNIKFILENAGIYNFLIGESLLKSQDVGLKLKQLTQISL